MEKFTELYARQLSVWFGLVKLGHY